MYVNAHAQLDTLELTVRPIMPATIPSVRMVDHQLLMDSLATVNVQLVSLVHSARPLSIHAPTMFARMVELFNRMVNHASVNAQADTLAQTVRLITHALSTHARMEVPHKL